MGGGDKKDVTLSLKTVLVCKEIIFEGVGEPGVGGANPMIDHIFDRIYHCIKNYGC